MKILKVTLAAFAIISCATASKTSEIPPDLMQQVLESKTYDIAVNSIVNNDGTKTNLLPNTTMSNGGNLSTSTIPLNKSNSSDYYIRVRPNIIAVNLPYEGKSRSSTLSYNVSDLFNKNIDVNNTNYIITTKGTSKTVEINLKDKVNNLKTILINIDKNGTASIKASKIADQTVTYNGYIYN